MTAEQLERLLDQREAQGLPRYVSDRDVARRLAVLLGDRAVRPVVKAAA